MVRKWGDVYPHETLIAHIRRLLDQEARLLAAFGNACTVQTAAPAGGGPPELGRLAAPAGTGLLGLAKELRTRCQKVVGLKGERVPK